MFDLEVGALLAAEALHELAPLAHLLLQHAPQIRLIVDDVGRERDDEVRLHDVLGGVAEEEAEDRDVAEDRDLGDAVDDLVGHQAADQDRLLILGDDDGLGRPLRGRRAQVSSCSRASSEILGVDLQADHVVLVDVRGQLDLQRHVLALHLREEAAQPEAPQRAGGRRPPPG